MLVRKSVFQCTKSGHSVKRPAAGHEEDEDTDDDDTEEEEEEEADEVEEEEGHQVFDRIPLRESMIKKPINFYERQITSLEAPLSSPQPQAYFERPHQTGAFQVLDEMPVRNNAEIRVSKNAYARFFFAHGLKFSEVHQLFEKLIMRDNAQDSEVQAKNRFFMNLISNVPIYFNNFTRQATIAAGQGEKNILLLGKQTGGKKLARNWKRRRWKIGSSSTWFDLEGKIKFERGVLIRTSYLQLATEEAREKGGKQRPFEQTGDNS